MIGIKVKGKEKKKEAKPYSYVARCEDKVILVITSSIVILCSGFKDKGTIATPSSTWLDSFKISDDKITIKNK